LQGRTLAAAHDFDAGQERGDLGELGLATGAIPTPI
jgi:hypothetical protein